MLAELAYATKMRSQARRRETPKNMHNFDGVRRLASLNLLEKREREREHSKWKIRDHHFMSQDRECSFHLLVALFSSIASNPHGHHLYHHDPHRAATPRVKVKSSSPLCPQFSWELQLILHLQLQFFPSSSES